MQPYFLQHVAIAVSYSHVLKASFTQQFIHSLTLMVVDIYKKNYSLSSGDPFGFDFMDKKSQNILWCTFFCLCRKKKLIQVWNDMRLSKWCLNVQVWVNYPTLCVGLKNVLESLKFIESWHKWTCLSIFFVFQYKYLNIFKSRDKQNTNWTDEVLFSEELNKIKAVYA